MCGRVLEAEILIVNLKVTLNFPPLNLLSSSMLPSLDALRNWGFGGQVKDL
jgi:hypothetical protein